MAGCRNAKKMGMPLLGLQDFILAGERRSDPIGRGTAEEVEMTEDIDTFASMFTGPPEGASRNDRRYCSFCGRSNDEVEEMVIGPCVLICADCVEMCADLVRERREAKAQAVQE